MPRVDRLVRKHADAGRLTHQQRQYLLYGMQFGVAGQRPFESEQAARAAWVTHREELMSAKLPSGTRPCGWWRYEIGMQPPRLPMDQIGELLGRKLIGNEEALRCERSYTALDPGSPTYCDNIGALLPSLSASNVTRLRREFLTARKWHSRRNRPQLVTKYTRLAGELREHLETRVLEGIPV